MSVLIPHLRVYNYVNAGLLYCAYNNTCDDLFCYDINRHFHNCPDYEAEAERLTRSWLQMNTDSYNKRYKENENLQGVFFIGATHKPLTALQLLKYIECIEYNIEIKPIYKQEADDLQLLSDFKTGLMASIICNMEEFKTASYAD